jgi:hypothetical protein
MRRRVHSKLGRANACQAGWPKNRAESSREENNLLKARTRWNIGNDRNALLMTFASMAG